MAMLKKILAADIGGTKTLLQLSEFSAGQYHVLYEQRYTSQDYASFDEILSAFRSESKFQAIDQACLGIAGPIDAGGNSARVTNLPWVLERKPLCKSYTIGHIDLINDFHAVAIGIETLAENELLTLQQGQKQAGGAQLVIGAGTGLGVALRVWNGSRYQILATEAGHAGFAPADQTQRQLLDYLSAQYPLVSREQLLSGQGLINIYQFICQQQALMANPLDASQICLSAIQGDPCCIQTVALFFNIYGSESGNLALATLPFGGVYIAGGIAARNIDALAQSGFVAAFCNKSKMGHLLNQMPIYAIRNENVGLLGARHQATLRS